jgi:hypothetical protein
MNVERALRAVRDDIEAGDTFDPSDFIVDDDPEPDFDPNDFDGCGDCEPGECPYDDAAEYQR